MEWNKEKQTLRKAADWWQPTPGQHKIKILDDGEAYTANWEDKEIPKVRFQIEIDGKEYAWGVTKGQTEGSLYGQLCLVGAAWQTLKDKEINLVVKGVKKDTSYTVLEALPLMQPKEESI